MKHSGLFIFFCCLSLSGCSLFGKESYYQQQKTAYAQAKDGPGLTIDPPLSSAKISDTYIIPPVEKAPSFIEAPPPPGSSLDVPHE